MQTKKEIRLEDGREASMDLILSKYGISASQIVESFKYYLDGVWKGMNSPIHDFKEASLIGTSVGNDTALGPVVIATLRVADIGFGRKESVQCLSVKIPLVEGKVELVEGKINTLLLERATILELNDATPIYPLKISPKTSKGSVAICGEALQFYMRVELPQGATQKEFARLIQFGVGSRLSVSETGMDLDHDGSGPDRCVAVETAEGHGMKENCVFVVAFMLPGKDIMVTELKGIVADVLKKYDLSSAKR